MTSQVVCIGDTHFQSGHWRNPDRIASMEQIVREGLAMPNLGAFLHLGDMWHARPNDDDLETVAGFVQRMADAAPTVLLLGNHGAAGYTQLLRRLKAKWPIIVIETPQVVMVQTATGETLRIAAIPYPQKSQLVAAGVAPSDIKREAERALDTICMQLAAELQATSGPAMLIGHATIAGATTSIGQPMGIEHDIAVTAPMLARFGNVPIVFGHVHLGQELYGAIYAGSIAANDWGETSPRRHVVVEFSQDEESVA